MESLSAHPAETEDSLSWILRALRPVAYRFKRGAEAKYQRFGFIADEVPPSCSVASEP